MPIRARRGLLLGASALLTCLVLLGLFSVFRKGAPSLTVRPLPQGEDRDQCRLQAVMHAGEGTVAVTETLRMRNRSCGPLDHTVLRFYLNAFRDEAHSPAGILYDECYPLGFSPGRVTLMGIRWQGESAAGRWTDGDETALRVETKDWEAGEWGTLTVSFLLEIPECRWRCQRSGDLWVLGNALALPAVYDGERNAYRLDPYTPIGDPFVSDCMDWQLSLSLEEGWVPYGSCAFEKGPDGTWTGTLEAARDMALLFFRGERALEKSFGQVLVRLVNIRGDREKVADRAGEILKAYTALYGPPPRACLTVAAFPFPFDGMEYPGLVLLSDRLFESGQEDWELPLAHECAHLWFYDLVGSDQVNEPWQDEALCQWAVLEYVRARYGEDSRASLRYYLADAPLEEQVEGSVTPGSPIDRFSDCAQYDTVVYGRGTAYLCALDTYTDGKLNAVLKAYADRFAWQRASRADFERVLMETAGQDLSSFGDIYLDTLIGR